MRTKLILCAALVAAIAGCNQKAGDKAADHGPKLETDEQKVSYGIGLVEGKRFKQDFQVDVDAFTAGLKASINDEKPLMTEEEVKTTIQNFGQKLMAKKEAEQKALGDKNKTASEAYLAENGKKEGIKTTASGLQYKVETEGKGAKPKADDTVEVNYRGTLVDGTEFDSSYKRGQTVTFPVRSIAADDGRFQVSIVHSLRPGLWPRRHGRRDWTQPGLDLRSRAGRYQEA
jgi:FKBP-type peptidyl-prolyl cis-trans isomerase